MLTKLFLLLVCVLTLIACGGGGGGGSSFPNSYVGTWAGTWANSVDNGNVTVTITDDRSFTGEITDPDLAGQTGLLSGEIDNNGTISGTFQYPGGATHDLEGTWQLSNFNGTLSGGALLDGGTVTNFTMTKQPG